MHSFEKSDLVKNLPFYLELMNSRDKKWKGAPQKPIISFYNFVLQKIDDKKEDENLAPFLKSKISPQQNSNLFF